MLAKPELDLDSDACKILIEMYHDHGDTIARQYGGSQLVNTFDTYRKGSGWTSHSRDLLNSIRRYYSNSFTDAEKQDAMNLFLGNYVPSKSHDRCPLWEMPTDYQLHYDVGRYGPLVKYVLVVHMTAYLIICRYREWFDPAWLQRERETIIPKAEWQAIQRSRNSQFLADVWEDYYNPRCLDSFNRMLSYKMMSTYRVGKDAQADDSPFSSRNHHR